MLLGNRANHPFEKSVPVGGGQSVGIGPIDLELAICIFVVPGIRRPAKPLHESEQSRHQFEIAVKSAQVVTGFSESVECVPRGILARRIFLQKHELWFDSDVDDITLLARELHLTY